jgi:hypothetical protein
VPNEAASALFQYPHAQVTDYVDLADVRAALERFPCCATDARGMEQGDPLNAAFVGDFADIGAAVVRRDYRRDARTDDMLQQVFGRAPDAVLRKEAQAGSPPTTLRAWLARGPPADALPPATRPLPSCTATWTRRETC